VVILAVSGTILLSTGVGLTAYAIATIRPTSFEINAGVARWAWFVVKMQAPQG